MNDHDPYERDGGERDEFVGAVRKILAALAAVLLLEGIVIYLIPHG